MLSFAVAGNGCTFLPEDDCNVRFFNGCDVNEDVILDEQDIYNFPAGIDICAHDVVLDCAGSEINSSGGGGGGGDSEGESMLDYHGISSYGFSGVAIQNCVVKGYDNGLHLEDYNDGTLANNEVSLNKYTGVFMKSSSRNDIHNNIVSENINDLSTPPYENYADNAGIFLEASHDNEFKKNDLRNNIYSGVVLIDSDRNLFEEDDFSDNGFFGALLIRSEENTLRGITAHDVKNAYNGGVGYFGYGVSLRQHSDRNEIHKSNMNRNFYAGVHVEGSHENTISDNNIQESGFSGISIVQGDNNLIMHNDATGSKNSGGIAINYGNNNVAAKNNVSYNKLSGISVYRGDNNIIEENVAQYNKQSFLYIHNGVGISIVEGSYNVIRKNDVAFNHLSGIRVSNTQHNHIEENKVYHNEKHGIEVKNNAHTNTLTRNSVHNNNVRGISIVGSNEMFLEKNSVCLNHDADIVTESSTNNYGRRNRLSLIHI